jgi:hypothetical protein
MRRPRWGMRVCISPCILHDGLAFCILDLHSVFWLCILPEMCCFAECGIRIRNAERGSRALGPAARVSSGDGCLISCTLGLHSAFWACKSVAHECGMRSAALPIPVDLQGIYCFRP